MKIMPDSVSRFAHKSLLKANANSPTILVVAGIVGLGATAVLASKATLKAEPIMADHAKARIEIKYAELEQKAEQKALVQLYTSTGLRYGKLYGPTLLVGGLSTLSILSGHKILQGRYVATMAAYTGLFDQFSAYRKRIAATFGDEKERDIYEGATLEWKEDPDHKGEHKLESNFDSAADANYLSPWFDETNPNWTPSPEANYLFLKGIQAHMNRLLEIHGYVFLNDVYQALNLPRVREGQVAGWVHGDDGDNYVDFGFMTGNDPNTIAFRNFKSKNVQLNFNIDGNIWTKLK